MNAPSTTFPYLTRARGRNVYEKLHKTLGAAKNGINGTGGAGQIYEWVDGGWNLLYDETGRPYSWQVAGIAKEKENTEKAIGINRQRALDRYWEDAASVLEKRDAPPHCPNSFKEGYVAAKMAAWDAQPEYKKKSRF